MPVTFIRRPIVTSGSNTFRFNSVALPTVYELERRDFTWNQVNDNGGKVQAQFNSVNLTTSFAVNDEIYVKALAGSPYDGFTTVTAVSFSGGNTLITVDINYVSTSTSGFINNDSLRPGYFLQVRFYDTSDVLLTESIFETAPTAKGNMTFDVSEFLKSFLSPDFENIAPAFNITQDTLAAKELYIATREVWVGSQELESEDDSNTIVAVLGAQQLPLSNGSNYGVTSTRFVSVQNSPNNVDARLLTYQSKVNVWREWPFTISMLFSDVSGDQIALNITGIQSTNTESASPHGGATDQLIRGNLGGITWDDFINDTQISIRFAGADTDVSIIADILEPCKNPVLLVFRNSLGGDFWQMFDGAQEYAFDEDNGTKVKRMLLSVDGLTEERWNELNDMITYGAELKENIVEILSTTNKTKTRAYQQVYKVDQDGTKTGVIVIPTTNNISNARLKHKFEVEIEFPEYFLP